MNAAIRRWEPRIEVTAIDFDLSRNAPRACIEVIIGYRIRATNEEHNLVYPFYVIPAEETA